MYLRRVAAAAACLCLLAVEAAAQSRSGAGYRPIAFELSQPAPVSAENHRLQPLEPAARARSTGMLESWPVAENAEIGIGRFGVGTVARPRTNMERDRMMERENRNIAGAGMRLRF